MTINNPALFDKNIWDYGFLDGCFGKNPKVKVSDLDGIVSHENEHFLVFEHKSHVNTPIPIGQGMTFERLLKTGLFTVVVIWGLQEKPEAMQVFYENGRTSFKKPCTLADIQKLAVWWFAQQEKNNPNRGVMDSQDWKKREGTG